MLNKVDPNTRRKVNKQSLELKKLQDEYELKQNELEKKEKILFMEQSKLADLIDLLENSYSELVSIEELIDSDYLPEGAQPVERINSRDRIKLSFEQYEIEVNSQRQLTQKIADERHEAERNFIEAEIKLHKFAETLDDLILSKKTIEKLDNEKEKRIQQMKENISKKKEKEKQEKLEAKAAQERELKKLKEEQDKIIKEKNKEAKKKLQKSFSKTEKITSQIIDYNEKHLQDRTEAVLELKANLNAVRAELASMAERNVKKRKDAQTRLDSQKDDMIARGLNPYVEFRKSELDAEAKAREARIKNQVEKNKRDLATRMEKEMAFIKNQEEKRLKAEEFEKQHRASQGRALIELRNAEYIKEKTIGNMELLDPLGKASRVDPSQVTEIPDYSFGLGKSSRIPEENRKKIIEKMMHNLGVSNENDFGEYERLVKNLFDKSSAFKNEDNVDGELLRTQSAPGKGETTTKTDSNKITLSDREIMQLSDLANQPGLMPGIENSAASINFNGNQLEKKKVLDLAIEEEGNIGKTSSQLNSAKSPKYKTRELTKFELDSFERAKNRHQIRIEEGVEQIAGGKSFMGDSFVSKPAELVFKDFEVGKKYKKIFTLTNVSYTFNSFKLLELDDEVVDFFTITFDKPGRMSAGMSCNLEIQFSPQMNQDIFTQINLFTETGPVSIPLNCLIKRCAPKLQESIIDFQSVIIGQKVQMQLKIINSQALPTKYSIFAFNENKKTIDKMLDEPSSLDENNNESSDEILKEQSANYESRESDRPDTTTEDINKQDLSFEELDQVESQNENSDPAINEAELKARVRKVMTDVVREKKKIDPYPLSTKQSDGFIGGYSSSVIDLVCAPLEVGDFERKFKVVFEGVDESQESVDEDGNLIKKEQVFSLKVSGEEVPIYVYNELLDLKCTLFDRLYRGKVILKNRGKSAYRVQVKMAKNFEPFVEVSPTMCFVQASESQVLNVKFAPNLSILHSVSHFSLAYENFQNSFLLSLPIEFQVVNQELPVHFILKSSVCSSSIKVSDSSLDFGKVYIGQCYKRKISLKNVSMLPQKISFVRLKKEISIQPNDGFAVLLPNEETEFEVSFSPFSSINYEFSLTLLTSFNDSYQFQVVAQGQDPPVQFEKSVILFKTTYPGQRLVESAQIVNNSKYNQILQVMPPNKNYSWINISPEVVSLKPGQNSRIEIEFSPPENLIDTDPTDWNTSLSKDPTNISPIDNWSYDSGWAIGSGSLGEIKWVKKDAGKPEVDENSNESQITTEEEFTNVSPEEWGIVGKWNIPILVKSRKKAYSTQDDPINPETLVKTLSSTSLPTKETGIAPSNPNLPLFISVQTSTVKPQIEADVRSIDFGQISIGTRVLKTFRIFNRSYKAIKLKGIGLNIMGPFSLLRPVKEIGPNESRVVIIECLPELPGLFVEALEFQNANPSYGGHEIRVLLKVQGLKPGVEFLGLLPPPPNWSTRSGIVDFGNVLEGDVITKSFTIVNKSSFKIDAKIIRTVGQGLTALKESELVEKTISGLPILSISPERIHIEEGEKKEIQITFRPDRGRMAPFREDFDVLIGQTDEILRIGVIGRCQSRQVIILPKNPRDESILNPIFHGYSEVEDIAAGVNSSLRNFLRESRELLNFKFPESPNIILQFPDPFSKDADPDSFKVIDGSTGGKNAKQATGNGDGSETKRQQIKKISLISSQILDGRQGSGNATFEIYLSTDAKQSGLWSLNTEKGTIPPNSEVAVDVICTLPSPRSLGGIVVGSWKVYDMEVIIKGGWIREGEPEERKEIIKLMAYICL